MAVDKTLYEILGVTPSASSSEIRKSYYHLAKKYHPDKNPEHGEKFKEISFAYDVLSNEDKKRVYDSHGLEGLKEGAASGGFAGFEDIFGKMFGGGLFGSPFSMFGGMGGHSSNQRRKAREIAVPLRVTLADLFTGCTKETEFNRKILCKACEGRGGPPGSVKQCAKCKGTGNYTRTTKVGVGMIQQVHGKCPDCQGAGETVRDSDRCKKCQGNKVLDEKKKLDVVVRPGMIDNERIVFRAEGNSIPGTETGDVIVVLQQEPHDTFQRKKQDLYMKLEINLTESLCGFKIPIKHLDGRILVLSHNGGDPLTNDSSRAVIGEGMPHPKYGEKGDLIVMFTVKFPKPNELTHQQLQELEKYLPAKPNVVVPKEDDEGKVKEVHMIEFEHTRGVDGTDGATMSDEEEGGPQVVHQCQTS